MEWVHRYICCIWAFLKSHAGTFSATGLSEGLNEKFTFSQLLGLTLLYSVLRMKCERKITLFVVQATDAFTGHKFARFFAQGFYLFELSYLNQVPKGSQPSWKRTNSYRGSISCYNLSQTKSSTILNHTMLFTSWPLAEHDPHDIPRLYEGV